MKVLLINTSERGGGAAVACNRLMRALNKLDGVEANMLVRDRSTLDSHVLSVNTSFYNCLLNYGRFCLERLKIFLCNGFSRKTLFAVSTATTGVNISARPEVKEADLIHLHWINQGMLSLKGIQELLKLGKPIVWTMHDMWVFTGICHYAGTCENFKKNCGQCIFLSSKFTKDLSMHIFQRKQRLDYSAIHFIACSEWLKGIAGDSKLLGDGQVISIPNPIDSIAFAPVSKEQARVRFNLPIDKKLILFGAAKIADSRKGLYYFCEAMKMFMAHYPGLCKDVELLFLGGKGEDYLQKFEMKVHNIGYLSKQEDIVTLYNVADVFVIPSLEDNLPNTIMEALACGTPVVGFRTGGIPEMVTHLENGYIADYKNSTDLMRGIYWVLFEADYKIVSQKARQKVVENYTEEIIAQKYYNLYNQLLNAEE